MDAVTLTGRRVSISKMTGREERMLLDVNKQSKIAQLELNRKLIDALVVGSDGKRLDYENMLIGEEAHILYLIRIASLGTGFEMEQSHGSCKVKAYSVDLRDATIWCLECDDKECPCHEFYRVESDEVIARGELVADLSSIPEDHYAKNPPRLETVLPDSQIEVKFRLATCSDKKRMNALAEDKNPAITSERLCIHTVSISGDTDPRKMRGFWDRATQLDRTHLLNELQKYGCGVDTEIQIRCEQCYENFKARFSMGSTPFWVPERTGKQRSRFSG
jgi:hypothetical protein